MNTLIIWTTDNHQRHATFDDMVFFNSTILDSILKTVAHVWDVEVKDLKWSFGN